MIADLKPYPAMKDSGVPWLGEVPEHWEVPRLGVLVRERGEINDDNNVTEVLSVMRERGVIPYAEKGNVGNKKSDDITRYKIVRPNDIVVNCMNVIIGSVGLSKYTGCLSPVYYVLTRRSEIDDPRYLNAYFQTKPFQLSLVRIGNGILAHRMRIPMELLKCEPFPRPPATEQAAIVRYLDYMDRRIRKYIRAKKKLIKLLEEQKQAIIHRAVTRGLDPNVLLKPSGVEWLGDVPAHWEVLPFMRLFDEVYRYPTYYNIQYVKSGVPEVRGEALVEGKIIELSDQRYIARETNDCFPKTILREGDIVMSVRGTMGKIGVVGEEHVGANIAANLLRLSPRREVTQSDYLSWLLRSAGFLRELDRVSPQTTIKTVTMPQLAGLRLCVPPLAEQKAIVAHVDGATLTVNTTIHRTEREIGLLREYRTRMIADVVTGKLDVREAAANLPDEAEEPELVDEGDAMSAIDEEPVDDPDTVPEEVEA